MALSDTIANVTVAIMCLTVSYGVAERYILGPAPVAGTPATAFAEGEAIEDSGHSLKLDSASMTAVVIVSSSCHFCEESVGFYRRLLAVQASAPSGAFQILLVGIGGEADATTFATDHQFNVSLARPIPPQLSAKVVGTPTLVLVKKNGRVVSSWVGRLGGSEEETVIASVRHYVESN